MTDANEIVCIVAVVHGMEELEDGPVTFQMSETVLATSCYPSTYTMRMRTVSSPSFINLLRCFGARREPHKIILTSWSETRETEALTGATSSQRSYLRGD